MRKLGGLVGKSKMAKVVWVIFFIVCIISGTFCFQYYKQLQGTMKDEGTGYLREISSRIAENIDQIMKDNYAALDTIAAALEGKGNTSFAEIESILTQQKQIWNCEDIMLIDVQGKAYTPEGREVAFSDNSSLRAALQQQKPAMSATQSVDGNERIVFAVPMQKLVVDGSSMWALAFSYNPSSIDKILSMSSFDAQAYSHLVTKEGTIAIRSSSQAAASMGYNVFTSIEKGTLNDGSSIQQLKDNIKNDKTGQIDFTLNGVDTYMTYTPVASDDYHVLTFVPASVVNAKSSEFLKITLYISGAITLLFAGMTAFLTYTFYRHNRKLEQIAYIDPVTHGNTIQRFYQLAKTALGNSDQRYVLVYINLENFKVLNEQFGRAACDQILLMINKVVDEELTPPECMGRLSADNFCVLMHFEDVPGLVRRFEIWFENAAKYIKQEQPAWNLPAGQFGIYEIDGSSIPFPQMIDRAKLALRESAHRINNRLRYAIYNDALRHRMFREKHLEDRMEYALEKGEFQVYLQPKYTPDSEKIGGAEALTRWVSEDEGMIYPDDFIPLFERNKFIVQLDLWVFEEVCKMERKWIDEGREPMRISVNCSRVHLKDSNFLNMYQRIAEKYQIPNQLIELELTESVVMEDSQNVIQMINDIRAAGFQCSMDDFGSGYSSLNLLQDIKVDTLKLDKIFFRPTSGDPKRMESVVGGIIGLAKALHIETVAEGVEDREQVAMLREMGCDLIQGYVFARPMPAADFEKLAFGGK